MKMNKKGFTLVELMVVLAILGLLAGIGIPQYMGILGRARTATDMASIAAVQSAVNTVNAETGKTVTAALSPLPLDYGGTSMINGTTVIALSDYLQGGVFPVLKTVTGTAAAPLTWSLTAAGKVSVTGGGVTLTNP